jgi:hypothetical protein
MNTNPASGGESGGVGASLSDAELRERFNLSTGGPNPFYVCRECDASVPGLRELLVEHAANHPATARSPQ